MATPFRDRFNTLMTALRWTLSGNPQEASALKAQMGSLAETRSMMQPEPSEWTLKSNGWEGDARWLWLLPPKDMRVREVNQSARLVWHMAYLWAHDKGPRAESLFWSAAVEAAKREKADVPDENDPYPRATALRQAKSTMARALVHTFPLAAQKALPWDEAFADWKSPGVSSWDMGLGAYLSVLARPDTLATDLKGVSKNLLQTVVPKECPWAMWLLLNDDGATLQRDLLTEGGASRWPGVQGWAIREEWIERLNARCEECGTALEAINAPKPSHPQKKFKSQPPFTQEMVVAVVSNAVHAATLFALPGSLSALLARGVNPNVPDAEQQFPLDRAVATSRLVTARTLVEGGAQFGAEQPEHPDHKDKNPWSLLFTTKEQATDTGFREPWRALEKAMWVRGEEAVAKWAPSQQIKLAYEAADHPHASFSLFKLLEPSVGLSPHVFLTGWLATQDGGTNTRVVRSLLTIAVHNPDWLPEEKEALIEKVFNGVGLHANAVLDDFASVPQLQTKTWADVNARPVNALTYAVVHAPKVVPDLLARSSPAQIQEALAGAVEHIGWKEGTSADASKALGVTHGWRKFLPIWAQALHSVDPLAAFAALAGHPITRADRDALYPLPIRDSTVSLTGMEYAMLLTNDSHSATEMLKVAGPVASINPIALNAWFKTPRDMDALRKGLAIAGCIEAPVDALGTTLLMQAYERKDFNLVTFLIEEGARLDGERSDGVSLQGLASAAGPEWLEGLVKAREARMGAVLAEPEADATAGARPRF